MTCAKPVSGNNGLKGTGTVPLNNVKVPVPAGSDWVMYAGTVNVKAVVGTKHVNDTASVPGEETPVIFTPVSGSPVQSTLTPCERVTEEIGPMLAQFRGELGPTAVTLKAITFTPPLRLKVNGCPPGRVYPAAKDPE